jgi:diguanylate cyclase (GGDEF)-like protein/PAS domain S-box-containing protein
MTAGPRADTNGFPAPELAAATLDSIGDAVLSTDAAGRVTFLNRAAEAMTGWTRDAARGRPVEDVLHIIDRDTRARARDPMALALQLRETVGLTPDCVLVRRDGREIAIEDSAAPIFDRDSRVTGAVIVFRDVGAALETSRRMSQLALHDALTGLPNRLLFTDRLVEATRQARRRGTFLAVCFLDIDRFKLLNDTIGHAAADEVLSSIALGLQGAVRQSDTVCRYGGDEFVVVLSEIEQPGHAALVAAKLLAAIAAPHTAGGRFVSCTASAGVSLYPNDGRDAENLIAAADAAMYDAKRSGPGGFRFFQGADEEEDVRSSSGTDGPEIAG